MLKDKSDSEIMIVCTKDHQYVHRKHNGNPKHAAKELGDVDTIINNTMEDPTFRFGSVQIILDYDEDNKRSLEMYNKDSKSALNKILNKEGVIEVRAEYIDEHGTVHRTRSNASNHNCIAIRSGAGVDIEAVIDAVERTFKTNWLNKKEEGQDVTFNWRKLATKKPTPSTPQVN